jgi:hypothetical protein
MTPEEKSAELKHYIAHAKEFNEWQDKAKDRLLTEIGPRIAKLNKTGYLGCGFHYGMEQSFGRLIVDMAIPLRPTMNDFDVCNVNMCSAILREVLYDDLVKRVEESEKTVFKS